MSSLIGKLRRASDPPVLALYRDSNDMVQVFRLDGTFAQLSSYSHLNGRYEDVRADCLNAAGDGSGYMKVVSGMYVSVERKDW